MSPKKTLKTIKILQIMSEIWQKRQVTLHLSRKTIGQELKRIIKLRNIEQQQLAFQTGIDNANISRILNDKRTPTIKNLIKICKTLNVQNLKI